MVTHRQRPSTAKGVIFINLEDETGLLNVVVIPDVWWRSATWPGAAVGLMIDGALEHRDGVTNLIARRFASWPVEGPVEELESRDWGRGGRG